MATVEFDEQPDKAYAALERAGRVQLLDAIDDAVDDLKPTPATNAAHSGLSAMADGGSQSGTETTTG